MPRKSYRKKSSRKTLKRRTMKGKRGGYYGFTGKVGTGAPQWDKGTEVEAPAYANGGKRRRRTRKGGMRFAGTSYSFKGTGTRGMADQVANGSMKGPAAEGAFNDFGAKPLNP
jgi:hypothetical protein